MISLFPIKIPPKENIPVLGFIPARGVFPGAPLGFALAPAFVVPRGSLSACCGPAAYPFSPRELSSEISSATSEVQPV
jgi:hypothetical protein